MSTIKRRSIQIIDVSPRKKSRNRTNSELTKTTSNLSQHIFVEARRKAESDADDPAEEAEIPIATDDSFPSDDEPETPQETPPEVDRNSIATRAKHAEWFTKPLHRLPDDELRAPTSTPDLSYALGSEAHAPSSRFDVAPPATVRSLARPDRRVLWESVDGAVSNHAKRTRQTLASKEIRIVGGRSSNSTFQRPRTSTGVPSTAAAVRAFDRRPRTALSFEPAKRLESGCHGNGGGSLSKSSSLPIFPRSPYGVDLARLRLEGLKLEEERLLEMKRLEELERIRGPWPRWYELRTKQFHLEARRNNDLLRMSNEWQDLIDYSKVLMTSSASSLNRSRRL